ncbi:thioredoxin domain-containing protein [Glaciibacter superstes]|uniref:thioredoxin domain-containing protein n=1 Tax=Glaciibacter superstes TaxID=501023 RepID=UPI0003B6FB58|nr:thioredoxin domain-containing protein [Glaciibacter superstes]
MPNRLADAISPYLRSHAENPVDWHSWGADAFAEAEQRDVPVLVSIGYSTCHWCHVMARESFSDPSLAEYLNANFVSIKVDREEHPDVDAGYLAAAGAFTGNLGWPLNVFVTPAGQAFYAGTYFPPQPAQGHPAFRQVLEAVTDAWTTRRDEVTSTAARVSEALAEVAANTAPSGTLPATETLAAAVAELGAYEDTTFGGFGGAPKFPVAPTLGFLLDRPDGRELALRTLKRMGASPLRDPIEGGFFRYATGRDWSDPHYERMLYDNAQLLDLYTLAWKHTGEAWARTVAEGVARYLTTVMRLPSGGFASAQDSESTVAGHRVEGGYYALGEDERTRETPPALDTKVLTGWNGLAITALARAGFAFGDESLITAARDAADFLLANHLRPDGTLVRASIDSGSSESGSSEFGSFGARVSSARATLEDFGMFAQGLLELALVTGEVRYATAARSLINSTLSAAPDSADGGSADGGSADGASADGAAADGGAAPDAAAAPFRAPNGADPVLAAQGLAVDVDPSEGAYPSGLTASADAAYTLYLLTADERYRSAAVSGMSILTNLAPARPIAFGAALRLVERLHAPVDQLVVVSPDATTAAVTTAAATTAAPSRAAMLETAARRTGALTTSVTVSQAQQFQARGFELFDGRGAQAGLPTAYLCRDFVCRLPVTDPHDLEAAAVDATRGASEDEGKPE